MIRTFITARNDVELPTAALHVLREHGSGAGYRIGTAVVNGTNKREALTRAVAWGLRDFASTKVRVLDEGHEYAGALIGHLDHHDSLLVVTSGSDVVEYMDRRWSYVGRIDRRGQLTDEPTGSQIGDAVRTVLPLVQGRTEHELEPELQRAIKVLVRAGEAYRRSLG